MPTFILLRIQRNEFLPKASPDNPHPLPSVSVDFVPWISGSFIDQPLEFDTAEEAFDFFKAKTPPAFRTHIAVQEKTAYEQSLVTLAAANTSRVQRHAANRSRPA